MNRPEEHDAAATMRQRGPTLKLPPTPEPVDAKIPIEKCPYSPTLSMLPSPPPPSSPARFAHEQSLDFGGLHRTNSPLRGLVNLFWVVLGVHSLATCYVDFVAKGSVFDWRNVVWTLGFAGNGTSSLTLLARAVAAHIAMPAVVTVVGLAANRFDIALSLPAILVLDALLIGSVFVVSVRMQLQFLHSLLFSLQALTMVMKLHSFLEWRRLSATPHKASVSARYFVWFMQAPVVVFATDLPRGSSVQWERVLEQLLLILVGWHTVHTQIERHILPTVLLSPQTSPSVASWVALFVDKWIKLLVPTLVTGVVLFWTFFEHFLSLVAAMSCFDGRRHFYGDWWNSTTFEEFARTWNLPVHHFLRAHFYMPFLQGTQSAEIRRRRKRWAVLTTFLVSSLVHELVVQVALRRPTLPFLFVFQMLQLPFTYVMKLGHRKLSASSTSVVRPLLAMNALFWVKMIVGPPLIMLLYWSRM